MSMSEDDALAPVIAVMLILAILATFLSIWNAVAIPSMKAESEVSHIREVEQGFARFGSDITNAAALHQEGTISETIPLGGGGIVFSPGTSAGTIQVLEEPIPYANVTLGNETTPVNLSLVEFSYQPVGSYWQDQGYIWRYGYVNVTQGYHQIVNDSTGERTGSGLEVPLSFTNMTELNLRGAGSGPVRSFARSLVDIEPASEDGYNLSSVEVTVVNFAASRENSFRSGNGLGTFALTTEVERNDSVHSLTIRLSNDTAVPGYLSTAVSDKLSESVQVYSNTSQVSRSPDNLTYTIQPEKSIRFRMVNITVYAY